MKKMVSGPSITFSASEMLRLVQFIIVLNDEVEAIPGKCSGESLKAEQSVSA